MNSKNKKNKNKSKWKMVRTEHYRVIDIFMDGDKLIRNESIVEIYERKRVTPGLYNDKTKCLKTIIHDCRHLNSQSYNRAPRFHMDLRRIPRVSYGQCFDKIAIDSDNSLDENENDNMEEDDSAYFIGQDISCKGYKRVNLGIIN